MQSGADLGEISWFFSGNKMAAVRSLHYIQASKYLNQGGISYILRVLAFGSNLY
jgi:hypothetical protein